MGGVVPDEICAMFMDGAGFAIRLCALADLLAVLLQQQVGALPGVELTGHFGFDECLRGAIGRAIVLALAAGFDSHQDMRAVRGHRGQRGEMTEEQNAIGPGISDAMESFELLAHLVQPANEGCAKIAAVFVLDTSRNLLKPHGARLREHAASLQGGCKPGLGCSKNLLRGNTDLAGERIPSPRARDIARRIPAVPPDQEFIRIDRPARLLGTIDGFEPVKQLCDAERLKSHSCSSRYRAVDSGSHGSLNRIILAVHRTKLAGSRKVVAS